MRDNTVYAAGCVLWRRSPSGGQEVAVIHRNRYDDWSHPKGKRDPGEDDLTCAVREVEEETGLRGTIRGALPTVNYLDHKGRNKVVRYWSMELAGGQFVVNDEVDELRWLSVPEAKGVLSYSHDQSLLDSLV
ncbi:MAG: NUDIX hydrolase [Acidimicrobiales bacterium]|nr:NUDIX hydrolase [Acidimicrobiales bacterium]